MFLVVFSLDCNLLHQSYSVVGELIWSLHVGLFVCNLRITPPPDVCPPQTLPNAVCGCRLRRQLVLGAKVAFRWTKVKWGFLFLFFNCALRIFFGFCAFKFSFFRMFANLMSECMNLGKVIFVLAALPHSRFVAISNAVFPFLTFCL